MNGSFDWDKVVSEEYIAKSILSKLPLGKREDIGTLLDKDEFSMSRGKLFFKEIFKKIISDKLQVGLPCLAQYSSPVAGSTPIGNRPMSFTTPSPGSTSCKNDTGGRKKRKREKDWNLDEMEALKESIHSQQPPYNSFGVTTMQDVKERDNQNGKKLTRFSPMQLMVRTNA